MALNFARVIQNVKMVKIATLEMKTVIIVECSLLDLKLFLAKIPTYISILSLFENGYN